MMRSHERPVQFARVKRKFVPRVLVISVPVSRPGTCVAADALLGKQTGLWLKDFYINLSKQCLDWPVVLLKTKHPTAKHKNICGRCSSRLEKLKNSCSSVKILIPLYRMLQTFTVDSEN